MPSIVYQHNQRAVDPTNQLVRLSTPDWMPTVRCCTAPYRRITTKSDRHLASCCCCCKDAGRQRASCRSRSCSNSNVSMMPNRAQQQRKISAVVTTKSNWKTQAVLSICIPRPSANHVTLTFDCRGLWFKVVYFGFIATDSAH